MAGTAKRSDTKSPDYERQFQEDLETARALSLESLELEKFKHQQQLEKLKQSSNSSFTGKQNFTEREKFLP